MSLQSLVSWVKRQSRLLKLNDGLLSRQHTSSYTFPCVLTPTGQGALNLPCRGLPKASVGLLGIKPGLPSTTLDVLSASVHGNSYSLEVSTFNSLTCILFRTQPSHLHLYCLTFLNVETISKYLLELASSK